MNRFDNIDCMDKDKGMPSYPDKFFDLAIVDPPYGELSSVNNRLSRKMFNNTEPPKEYYYELTRASKNQIVWGWNYLQNCPYRGGGIVWNKLGIDTSRRLQAPTIGDAEFAYQSLTQNIKIFSYGWMGNVTGNDYQINSDESRERIHPTQKPIALYKWLLTKYAKPNDKILDTHVGSASSLIACEDMGFEYVGFELDTDYYNSACKRLEQFRSQLKLAI